MKLKKLIAALLAATITAGMFPVLQGFADTDTSHEATLERTCSIYYQDGSMIKSINGALNDETKNGYEQYNKNSTVDGKNWGGYALSQFTLTEEQINAGIAEATFEAYISDTNAKCKVKADETQFIDYNSLSYTSWLETYNYSGCGAITVTGDKVTVDGTEYAKISVDVSECIKNVNTDITVAVTSCNSRAKMLSYGSEYQPKLMLIYDGDIETIPEKENAVYSVITKAASSNPIVDISKISNSVNITGYQVTVARDHAQISQTMIERGNSINGLDSIDVTASEGDDIEIAPIYEYKKTLSYGSGITLADIFPDGRYNITVTNGSTNHTDLYVNGYMAANNIDQNGAGRSVSTGSTYTANDIRVEGNGQKITIQTKDSANSLSYVKVVKSPSVVSPKKKIFITGDSLVANYYGGNEGNDLGNTQTGWGQALSEFIHTDKYEVVNLANAGYWAATLKTTAYPGIIYNAEEGDIFLLESGVNDYWNPDSKGATAGLDTNRNTMKTAVTEMVQGAKDVDLPIILVNPNAMPSRHDTTNCFGDVMLEIAEEQNVLSIDLSALSSKVLTSLYYDENADTFKNNIGNNLGVLKGKASDYTHSSYLGAMKYASIVAEELYKLGYEDMINTEYSYSKKDSLNHEVVCKVSTQSPSEKQCVKITAEYDGNGTLKNIRTDTINISDAAKADNSGNIKTFYWESLESMKPIEFSSEKPSPSEKPDISNSDYVFIFGSDHVSDDEIAVDTNMTYGEQADGMTYGFYGLENSPDVSDGRTDGFKYFEGEPYTILKSGNADGKSYVEADYSAYDENTLKNIAGGKMPVRFSVEAEEHKYYTVSATVVNTSATENANVTLYSEKRHAILSGYTLKPHD